MAPAVGNAVFITGGTAAAFALNGVTFFISAGYFVPLLRQDRGAADGLPSVARQSPTPRFP
ncbi:MAG: hypothetical protein R2867_10380 [Caldilineaceae bacterium]